MRHDEAICKVTLPILQRGDRGDAVRSLQLLLIGNGYSCGYKAEDGVFGRDTEGALRAFQKEKDLPISGRADGESWRNLLLLSGYEEVIATCRY